MLRLKLERIRRGLNQTQVATIARLWQTQISQMERGRLIPNTNELQRLADTFKIYPPEKLLEDVEVEIKEI